MRSQTRNLIELLTLARHRGTYYLFMEDDFRWVPRVQRHHGVYSNVLFKGLTTLAMLAETWV